MQINMRYILLHIVLLISFASNSQISVSRQVIGCYGGTSSTSFGEYSYNMGESVVTTGSSTSFTLTQGFEQLPYSIEMSPINFVTVNAFSPNGDSVNDVWVIPGISGFGENKVYIMNRWGDQVAEFSNYDNITNVWDGTNRMGDPLVNGTYFYVIELTELGIQESGWVQITK